MNVNSRIPFNLHNRVLPPEIHQTLSRSTSGSLDMFNDSHHHDHYHTHSPLYNQVSPLPSSSPSPRRGFSRSRSNSPGFSDEDSRQKPILNVRLVGFAETRVGRTRARRSSSKEVASLGLDLGLDNSTTKSPPDLGLSTTPRPHIITSKPGPHPHYSQVNSLFDIVPGKVP